MPLQQPGLGWVEITYSSLKCLNHGRLFSSNNKHSSYTERRCLQTFVFVGDLMSMAHSIHLTSYRPRLSVYFISHLPDMFEKFFTCAFHVSMILALLNSLPVGPKLHKFSMLPCRPLPSSALVCCTTCFNVLCSSAH